MNKRLTLSTLRTHVIGLVAILLILAGCSAPAVTPVIIPSTVTPTPSAEKRTDGLSDQDAATLGSLKQVDRYPLYTMRYHGSLYQRAFTDGTPLASANLPAWGCSLFATLGDPGKMFYGRNFDWEYSPALLLFTDPPDGYASVSMVDIAYLGFGGARANGLTDLPLAERRGLLSAPFLPFDGMNERGLAVGMAAVSPGDMSPDPNKETIDSLMVIRKMLDQAGNVDEAVAILQRYNISMGGGPPLHYLVADRSGRAALVEFYRGKMNVIPNDKPWHQATNFIRSAINGNPQGQCWRYDAIQQQLAQAEGKITVHNAMRLLKDVSQKSTQWSIVYGLSTGDISVTMGQQYDTAHTFRLDLSK